MRYEVVEGDLLDQDVEAIVNPWNRNTIPWWLLFPQGVSGAIKKRAGTVPFKQVAKFGRLSVGQAVATSAGELPFKAIIHVAGINDFWRATELSVHESVVNAVRVAQDNGLRSIAFPLIGSGSGGLGAERALRAICAALDELEHSNHQLEVRVVVFKR